MNSNNIYKSSNAGLKTASISQNIDTPKYEVIPFINMNNSYSMISDTIHIKNFKKQSNLEKTITIDKAENKYEINQVFNIRWEGYKKYFTKKREEIDIYDFEPNVVHFLAKDENNKPVGTIRILDRRFGKIELDEFIKVDSFLPDNKKSCVEVTRFSIPNHPKSKLIKMLLWKSVLLYCRANRINVIIASCRSCAARAYRCLGLENVGIQGSYSHPLLGNKKHTTYKCDISKSSEWLKNNNSSLYNFFFKENHPNIKIDLFNKYNKEKRFNPQWDQLIQIINEAELKKAA